MKINTFKAKLIAWNTLVLWACLFLFGGALHLRSVSEFNAQVDANLDRAAARKYYISSIFSDPMSKTAIQLFLQKNPGVQKRLALVTSAHDDEAGIFDLQGHPSDDVLGLDAKLTPFDSQALTNSVEGKTIYKTIQHRDSFYRLISKPLPDTGQGVHVIQAILPLSIADSSIHHLDRILFKITSVGLLLTAFGGAFLAERMVRPVGQMAAQANRIGAESLSSRLPVAGVSELDVLARAFNGLLSRLQRSFELQQRFLADASHELRTPLTVIKANTTLALARRPTLLSYRQSLVASDRAADTMTRLVDDLLFLSKSDAGHLELRLEPVQLNEVVAQALESIGNAWEVRDINLHKQLPDDFSVETDEFYLHRLVANLLSNAVAHTPSGGTVCVEGQRTESGVELSVIDTGCGMSKETLERLGERFFRADADRSRASGGTGLGLAICYSIVELLGGSMAISSELGVGTSVQITLPSRSSWKRD